MQARRAHLVKPRVKKGKYTINAAEKCETERETVRYLAKDAANHVNTPHDGSQSGTWRQNTETTPNECPPEGGGLERGHLGSELEFAQRAPEGGGVERGHWGSELEFVLACVGWSVGIGNVWRFPFLAYENGGGAFLIPYIVMLILAGKPMYFMELAFGQFGGLGAISIWKCAPIAKGVGYGMVILSLVVAIYYNVVMAYTLYYFVASFHETLPWTLCGQEWNTENCVVRGAPVLETLVPCTGNTTVDRINCLCSTINTQLNGTGVMVPPNCACSPHNTTLNDMFPNCANATSSPPGGGKPVTASEEYWLHFILDLGEGIEDVGTPRWQLCVSLFVSWLVVFFCLSKGVRSVGKVVYVTATFPYVILLVLLVRGVTLEGAGDGILYFITPTWSKLLDIKVWKDAAGQMFFSLGVSWGGLIMFGSFNKFKNNVYRDALLISMLDTLTSLLAGVVIFSVLGAMSKELALPIDQVATGGQGLAFVAYPEAIARLPIPQLWAALFFFMLFILGLDSEFALLENVLTAIIDEYPHKLRPHRTWICLAGCMVCFFLGLPCATRGGQYVLNLMDTYGGGFAVIFIAMFECIAIMWVYGAKHFVQDLELMLGFQPNMYWKVAWTILAPVTLTVIFVYSVVTHKPIKYGSYAYPAWADGIGWLLALLSMVQIPLWVAIELCRRKGTFVERFHDARSPAADWGPSDPSVDLQHYNKRCLALHKTGQVFNLQPVLVMTVHPDGDDPERGSSPNTPEEAVHTLGNQEVNI